MKRSHVQYTINLNNTFDKTTQLVSENIDSFNKDIFRFINNQFGVTNKSDYRNKEGYDPGDWSEDEVDINESKENDLSGNDIKEESKENDLSGNDIEDESKENDLSGNDIEDESKEKDLSGNDIDDENEENDLSGNDIDDENEENEENDLSGNDIDDENDIEDELPNETNNEDEPYINNNTSNHSTRTNSIGLYNLPPLKFNTKKKIIKKFYKKLIVKLHPDKRKKDKKNDTLFKQHFEECKKAMEMNCVYKLWLLTIRMKIYVKITKNIESSILSEINLLKSYLDNLVSSPIYKWITMPEINRDLCIKEYISKNMVVL